MGKSHVNFCLGSVSCVNHMPLSVWVQFTKVGPIAKPSSSRYEKNLGECLMHHRTEYKLRNKAVGVNLVAEFD